MKTRQEMIYDFMLALAPSYDSMYENIIRETRCGHSNACNKTAEEILNRASELADLYLEIL
jgi:hypothetical protein